MKPTLRKAQGNIEYILLIAAAAVIVIIGLILIRGNVLYQGGQTAQANTEQWNATVTHNCDLGIPCPSGYACYNGNATCMPNLLTNPGFEVTLGAEWTEVTASATRTTETKVEGSYSMVLNATGAGNPLLRSSCYAAAGAAVQHNLVFSAKAALNASTSIATARITTYDAAACGGAPTTTELTFTRTRWTSKDVTVAVTGGTSYQVELQTYPSNATWFDDISVIQVN